MYIEIKIEGKPIRISKLCCQWFFVFIFSIASFVVMAKAYPSPTPFAVAYLLSTFGLAITSCINIVHECKSINPS